MELTQILQLCFMFGIFLLNLLFVILPLKLISSEPQRQAGQSAARKTQKVLDFCNSFSCGVFLGTCFIQLLPHAEMTMEEAFMSGGLSLTYCSSLTQLASMLGFFSVLLIDRCIEVCRGGRTNRPAAVSATSTGHVEADEHELTSVKNYIVSVSSSESTLSDDESDLELVRERDSMLRSKAIAAVGDGASQQAVKSKNKRLAPPHTKKPGNANGSAVGAKTSSKSGSSAPRCHAHLVAPAEGDDLNLHCIILLLALSLHSLFEGVAIGLQDSVMTLTGLSIGVTVHGCLVAFALGIALATRCQMVRLNAVRYGVIYSTMVPVGIGIGMAVGSIRGFIGRLVSALLQSLTAGTFVYVIFVEIFPVEMNSVRNRMLKVFINFVGFVVICCLHFIVAMVHQ